MTAWQALHEIADYRWLPLGGNTSPFSGSFNGQGHEITGLSISDASGDCTGFFGETATGTIENLGVSAQVYGTEEVGALVGQQDSGEIINVYAIGSVSGGQENGGLIGYQSTNGTVLDSFADVSVLGTVDSTDGGLVGFSKGIITDS